MSRLRDAYGTKADDSSPRVIINKMATHPSKRRPNYGVYDDVLRKLFDPIHEITETLETLIGRRFQPVQ